MVTGRIARLARFLAVALAILVPQFAAARTPEVRSVLSLEAPLTVGEYAWDDTGVAPGPTRIVVDLAAQKLYVYRGGTEIGRAFILYGADHKPTPTGRFPILQKNRDHVSNLYGAPMPFMLRLTWGGIAIHGSEVERNAATHGCIGVPDEFAERLFAVARKGDVVTVTRRWMPALYGEEIDAPDPHGEEEIVDEMAAEPVNIER